MDHAGQVYAFESFRGLIRAIGRGFFKNQHLRMVINCKSFFGKLVVDLKGPKRGVILKNRRQFIPKLALKNPRFGDGVTPQDVFLLRAADERAVELAGKWIALWYSRDGSPLAVGADEEGVCLVKYRS